MRSKSPEIVNFAWLKRTSRLDPRLLAIAAFEAIDGAAWAGLNLNSNDIDHSVSRELEYYLRLPMDPGRWLALRRLLNASATEWATDLAGAAQTLPAPQSPVRLKAWIVDALHFGQLELRDPHRVFNDPVQLIVHAHDRLIDAAERLPLQATPIPALLVCAGLGILALWSTRNCKACFRTAAFGFEHCSLHSQSKAIRSDDSSAIAQRLVRARKSEEQLKQMSWSTSPPLGAQPQDTLYPIVAGIISIMGDDEHHEFNAQVAHALRLAPLVKARLPENFSELDSDNQLSLLRACIDPFEYVPTRWPHKILAAQDWFSAELVSDKDMRFGLKEETLRKYKQAQMLRSQGRSHQQIADELEITASNLSHILRRVRQKGGLEK